MGLWLGFRWKLGVVPHLASLRIQSVLPFLDVYKRQVSRLLKDKFFRQALKDAKSSEEIIKIIREEDEY